MTRPSQDHIERARSANASMARDETPFIANVWYVAAFGREVGRTLFKRRILDRPLVFYRTLAGKAVALADRCAHRSFPLSASRLDGDTIVCGYHGFRYDQQGDCIEVPSMAKCPSSIGVSAYPLVELGPLLWIWVGDPAQADPALIPDQPWICQSEWAKDEGHLALPCNYVSLHENLMDLTHIEFLHSETLGAGAPGYSAAPFSTEIGDEYFALARTVEPASIPLPFEGPMGFGPVSSTGRSIRSEFLSPAFHQLTARYYDSAEPAEQRRECVIKTAHLPTPETHKSTHYFIVNGRNFAQDDEAVSETLGKGLFDAFMEDVEGLSLLQANLDATPADDMYELSVKSDSAAVAMRRYLKRAAEQQTA